MEIIIVAAVSKDGFITDKNGSVNTWTSEEDKKFFKDIRENHKLFIMGSTTYNELHKPLLAGPTRVVITSDPTKYDKNADKNVVFTNDSPLDIVQTYQPNYESCLLLGGAQTYKSFLSMNLVDTVLLTIEPIALSEGLRFLPDGKDLEDYGLHVTETKQLNDSGTTLFTFKRQSDR